MSTHYTCGETPHQIHVSLDEGGNIILIDMPRWSNFHAHLRDGEMTEVVAYYIMRFVKYLLVMPNTGPIRTIADVRKYHKRLMRIRDKYGLDVVLVMTLYFTPELSPEVIEEAKKLGFRVEIKYYPPEQGATTGSGFGMPLAEGKDVLDAMSPRQCNTPLLLHGESVHDRNGNELSHELREAYFYQNVYPAFRDRHPDNLVCGEHLSTRIAVDTIKSDTSGKTVCTITPHHLLFTMEELLGKSWRNHGRCMPYLKTADDRAALREFAFSGDYRAIAGDDTAPHPAYKKTGGFGIPNYPRRRRRISFENAACGCWLPHSVGLYAMAARICSALDERFVQFMCLNGAAWRGLELPRANERMQIVAAEPPKDIPDPLYLKKEKDYVVPLGWSTEADRLKIGHALLDQMHC